MANIFLDVNVLIDFICNGGDERLESLRDYQLSTSTLSWHIVCYLMKWKIPNDKLSKIFNVLMSVEMSNSIVKRSMHGPTDDFEDNVQLHSASEAECDYFLTLDKKLLKMKYFGKMKISNKID